MNTAALAARIVSSLDDSTGDSRLNRCDTVQNMIEAELGEPIQVFLVASKYHGNMFTIDATAAKQNDYSVIKGEWRPVK